MSARPSTDAIWERLSADLRRFIRRRVSDEHAADDLVQETFARVHRSLDSLAVASRLDAWIYRIARNVIHDHYRKTRPAEPLDDAEQGEAEPDPDSCRCAAWLGELIDSLPDGYRQAVHLGDIEGMPQQQVADRLGLSLSAAKSRIQRGRTMLKDALEQCCQFELDRRGNVMNYVPRPERNVCRDCGD